MRNSVKITVYRWAGKNGFFASTATALNAISLCRRSAHWLHEIRNGQLNWK